MPIILAFSGLLASFFAQAAALPAGSGTAFRDTQALWASYLPGNAGGETHANPAASPAAVSAAAGAAAASPAGTSLDFDFFRLRVQPIFLNKRPGHARCISCHSNPAMAIMRLQPLPPGSTTWNEEDSRKNFEAVKQVAVPGNLKSPLLTHPLAEQAGGDFFHNGGKHFNSQDDPEWQTLKAWVLGATSSANQ